MRIIAQKIKKREAKANEHQCGCSPNEVTNLQTSCTQETDHFYLSIEKPRHYLQFDKH